MQGVEHGPLGDYCLPTNQTPMTRVAHAILLSVLCCIVIGQEPSSVSIHDHQSLIDQMVNSQDLYYEDALLQYDAYLKVNPEDILVQIQKCKFIQFAQYDDYDDYNPNQELFDSLSTALALDYPDHPDVLVFASTYLWGDEEQAVYERAVSSMYESPGIWSDENRSTIYFSMAQSYYYDDDLNSALNYIEKAQDFDGSHITSMLYSNILVELGKDEEALSALLLARDSTETIWEMGQRAGLLLQLEDYPSALLLYSEIAERDSTYNNNLELSKVMEGGGEYAMAREYLVRDTAMLWDKEAAAFNLFEHDLKYHAADTCLTSYNTYREQGYSADPIGLYRLKLFFKHPFLSWKARDLLGLVALLILVILLIIVPSVWILPVYFIGHRVRKRPIELSEDSRWGLKSFWWVSAAYLVASFIGLLFEPEYLNSLVNNSNYYEDETEGEPGISTLVFILSLAFLSLLTLYKVNWRVLLFKDWKLANCMAYAIGAIVAFRIALGVYVRLGMELFDLELDEIMTIPQLMLSMSEEIKDIFAYCGNGIGVLIIAVLVPIYEEVMFRGVILESAKRYIGFNWANLLQATLFAAVHGSLFLFPVFLAFGLITGVMARRSGGLLTGMLFHMFNNLLVSMVLMRSM